MNWEVGVKIQNSFWLNMNLKAEPHLSLKNGRKWSLRLVITRVLSSHWKNLDTILDLPMISNRLNRSWEELMNILLNSTSSRENGFILNQSSCEVHFHQNKGDSWEWTKTIEILLSELDKIQKLLVFVKFQELKRHLKHYFLSWICVKKHWIVIWKRRDPNFQDFISLVMMIS